jgi:hypothetical protein
LPLTALDIQARRLDLLYEMAALLLADELPLPVPLHAQVQRIAQTLDAVRQQPRRRREGA